MCLDTCLGMCLDMCLDVASHNYIGHNYIGDESSDESRLDAALNLSDQSGVWLRPVRCLAPVYGEKWTGCSIQRNVQCRGAGVQGCRGAGVAGVAGVQGCDAREPARGPQGLVVLLGLYSPEPGRFGGLSAASMSSSSRLSSELSSPI